jgi:hypothetical protein
LFFFPLFELSCGLKKYRKMPKPMRVSDVLRQQTPRKNAYSNRFAPLSDGGIPAPKAMMALEPASQRPRSNSVKRKEPEGPSFSQIVVGATCSVSDVNSLPHSVTISEGLVTDITTEITKVTSVCDKVADNIDALEADPAVLAVFTSILTALRGVTDVQCRIVLSIYLFLFIAVAYKKRFIQFYS